MDMDKKIMDVVACLIKEDGKILFAQRKKGDSYGLLWEFPGGKVEEKEKLEEALIREIKEELGVDIVVEDFIHTFEDENDNKKIVVHLFSCKIISGFVKPLECNKIEFLSLEEAKRLNLAPVDKKILDFLIKSYEK